MTTSTKPGGTGGTALTGRTTVPVPVRRTSTESRTTHMTGNAPENKAKPAPNPPRSSLLGSYLAARVRNLLSCGAYAKPYHLTDDQEAGTRGPILLGSVRVGNCAATIEAS
ncbi:MAG: hypothetical protein JWN95_295 [Frankiales bacterium]|nr:hypothetical protein [Frankiales bacterium]